IVNENNDSKREHHRTHNEDHEPYYPDRPWFAVEESCLRTVGCGSAQEFRHKRSECVEAVFELAQTAEMHRRNAKLLTALGAKSATPEFLAGKGRADDPNDAYVVVRHVAARLGIAPRQQVGAEAVFTVPGEQARAADVGHGLLAALWFRDHYWRRSGREIA